MSVDRSHFHVQDLTHIGGPDRFAGNVAETCAWSSADKYVTDQIHIIEELYVVLTRLTSCVGRCVPGLPTLVVRIDKKLCESNGGRGGVAFDAALQRAARALDAVLILEMQRVEHRVESWECGMATARSRCGAIASTSVHTAAGFSHSTFGAGNMFYSITFGSARALSMAVSNVAGYGADVTLPFREEVVGDVMEFVTAVDSSVARGTMVPFCVASQDLILALAWGASDVMSFIAQAVRSVGSFVWASIVLCLKVVLRLVGAVRTTAVAGAAHFPTAVVSRGAGSLQRAALYFAAVVAEMIAFVVSCSLACCYWLAACWGSFCGDGLTVLAKWPMSAGEEVAYHFPRTARIVKQMLFPVLLPLIHFFAATMPKAFLHLSLLIGQKGMSASFYIGRLSYLGFLRTRDAASVAASFCHSFVRRAWLGFGQLMQGGALRVMQVCSGAVGQVWYFWLATGDSAVRASVRAIVYVYQGGKHCSKRCITIVSSVFCRCRSCAHTYHGRADLCLERTLADALTRPYERQTAVYEQRASRQVSDKEE